MMRFFAHIQAMSTRSDHENALEEWKTAVSRAENKNATFLLLKRFGYRGVVKRSWIVFCC